VLRANKPIPHRKNFFPEKPWGAPEALPPLNQQWVKQFFVMFIDFFHCRYISENVFSSAI